MATRPRKRVSDTTPVARRAHSSASIDETDLANGAGQQRRREEIFAAAAEIFHSKGYDGTSIQDIASAVGLLKGSIYYYIDSKEDLLFGIVQESHAAALDALADLRADSAPPLAKVVALVRRHVEVFTSTRIESAVFFREFRSLSPERQDIIREEGGLYTEYLRELIRTGQRRKMIDPALDPKLATEGITGMLNAMSFWYHPDGAATPVEIGWEFARIVVTGLASSAYVAEIGGRDALLDELGFPTPARKRGRVRPGPSPSNGR